MCGRCLKVGRQCDKMSTSSEMYTARINTPVHISLTGLNSTNHTSTSVQLSSDEASSMLSRLESCPTSSPRMTFNSSTRHVSLTLIISTSSRDRLCASNNAGRGRRHGRQDLARYDNGVSFISSARRRRDAPVPPRLPHYTEIEPPPPPYNPDFLTPISCHRWSEVLGPARPSSLSDRCPPPPPPSRSSMTPAERSSLPLVAEPCAMADNEDGDDDVFFTEKPAMLDR